jgi:uncharacterized repeat protein (TIGR01451 family)
MAVNRSGLRTAARAVTTTGVLALLMAALLWPAAANATPPRTFTCGKTAVGKTADALIANQKRVNACALLVNATLTELVFYLAPTSRSGSEVLSGVLYADNKGSPGALLGTTAKVTFSSKEAAGWRHFLFPAPIKLKAGEYWFGVLTGNMGKVAGERWDTVLKAEDYNSNTYTAGASNPFGAFKNTSEQMSLYGVFTPEEAKKSSLAIEKLQQVGKSEFVKTELKAKVGETVKYEIVVTNTGETTLTLSNFSDTKCSNISGGASSLEAGKSTTWVCEHKLTEGGKYANSATVEANEGVGKKESNTVTVEAEQVPGTCEPSSSLSVLIFGKNVLSYVPKGFWDAEATQTGVSVVNVEGSAITPTKIETKSPVNSCASNSVTGVTVCTANTNEVYVIKEAKIEHELTSGASGTIRFSGGSCTNCGVAMDSAHNRALIGLSIEGKPGFQFLNLETLTFEKAFAAASGAISEEPLIDPTRELILSPTEQNHYELVNVTKASEPAFYDKGPITVGIPGEMDSAAEDCSTGIALASIESQNSIYLTDLTQAKFTPGSPAGTWTAPEQVQKLEETTLEAGTTGIAVAQGTHTGTATGEFGGNEITALALPETSGSGTPALKDYVTCSLGSNWFEGFDPHTVTAYQSPNGGDAIALFANGKENATPPFEEGATEVAKVDLTKMLNPSIVKRTAGGHACEAGTLPAAVVSFISVP